MALKKPPAPPGALRGDPPNQVLPYLFIGSAANAANRTELVNLGITHILNVKESYFATTPTGFEFLHVAMSDYGNQDIHEVLPQCFNFIETAKNANGKVLVHCRGGVNRSATVVLAWMMHGEKMILKDAWHMLRSKRSVVSPHEQYIAQLKAYEEELFGTITLTPEDTGLSAQARMRQFMLLGRNRAADTGNGQPSTSSQDLLQRASGPAPRLSRGSVSGLGSSSVLVRESNSQPTAPEIEGMSQASLAIEVASKDSPAVSAETRERSESSTTASRSESPGTSRKSKSGDSRKKHRHHGRSGSNVSNSANSVNSDNDSTTSSLRQSEKSHTEASDSSHSTCKSAKKKKKKSPTASLSTSDSSTSIRSRSPSGHADTETSPRHKSGTSKRRLSSVDEENSLATESKPRSSKRGSRSSATATEPKPAGSASESDHTVPVPDKQKRSKSKSRASEADQQSSQADPADSPSSPKGPPPSKGSLKGLISGIFGRTKSSKKDHVKVTVSPAIEDHVEEKLSKSSDSEEKGQGEKKGHRKTGERHRHSKHRMAHSSSFSISASTSTSTSSGKHTADAVNSNKHESGSKHSVPANIKILSQDRASTSARSSSSTSSSGT